MVMITLVSLMRLLYNMKECQLRPTFRWVHQTSSVLPGGNLPLIIRLVKLSMKHFVIWPRSIILVNHPISCLMPPSEPMDHMTSVLHLLIVRLLTRTIHSVARPGMSMLQRWSDLGSSVDYLNWRTVLLMQIQRILLPGLLLGVTTTSVVGMILHNAISVGPRGWILVAPNVGLVLAAPLQYATRVIKRWHHSVLPKISMQVAMSLYCTWGWNI
mmetsp:Transcript_21350/g.36207  ORF Transcript_21350/g.36207 Transcript_21350/m.36207 type:complete len:214 (-) Transcript_21350:919-1560(-)